MATFPNKNHPARRIRQNAINKTGSRTKGLSGLAILPKAREKRMAITPKPRMMAAPDEPIIWNATQTSQIAVPSRKTPKIFWKIVIQFPGFGRIWRIWGKMATRM